MSWEDFNRSYNDRMQLYYDAMAERRCCLCRELIADRDFIHNPRIGTVYHKDCLDE